MYQTPSSHENSFPSQISFVPLSIVWVAFVIYVYQAPAQLTAQKQNEQLYQPFVPSKVANESWTHFRTAETRKLSCKATLRRLVCSVA
jgi:ABC-type transport system involved in cytochrome c biogenesis permease subunit